MIPTSIRAVAFDAGGTLLEPHPAAAVVYAEVGRRYGSQLTAPFIAPRFTAAFARQEHVDKMRGQLTNEQREAERWRQIVAEVLDDLDDPEACFQELFAHYGLPHAWRCPEATEEVLATLAERGLALALASNYDRRLHTVAAGLPALRRIEHVVISSEVGWRKPSPTFFAALCGQLNCQAREIVFVGDDLTNDCAGARGAGLHALLFDPHDRHTAFVPRIRSLDELLRPVDGELFWESE